MARFVAQEKLGDEIQRLFSEVEQEDSVYCAVAFWGYSAKGLIKNCRASEIKIICNLDSGATNPNFVRACYKDNRVTIKNIGNLHAKVYIGRNRVIVGSANASANGLGFHNNEVTGWIEAGVVLTAERSLNSIAEWFDELWYASREITHEHIEDAKRLWAARRRNRPTSSFLNYPLEELPNIIISWWPTRDLPMFETNKDSVIQALGEYSPEIEEKIQGAIDIEVKGDEEHLERGFWVLRWEMRNNGQLSKSDLSWFYVGPFIHRAGAYRDEPDQLIGVVIEGENPPPPPFEVRQSRDPIFRKAFQVVIESEQFEVLRNQSEYEDWSFRRTIGALPTFWRALRNHYFEFVNQR